MGRAEFLALVDGYLAGSLDAAGLAALEAALQAQPPARRLFALAVQHEILLRQYAFEQLDGDDALPAAPAQHSPAPVAARAWWRAAGVRWTAAALLLAALGLLALAVLPARAPAPLAELVSALDDGAGATGSLLRAGAGAQPLRPPLTVAAGDRIILPHGAAAELRLAQEATTISLGGGSALRLLQGPSGIQLALERGRLTAAVAHQAAGRQLTISTPEAAIAVIGTRLTVSRADARTAVAVDEGRVRVRCGQASAEVGAGERSEARAGEPLAVIPAPALSWSDRRPLGVMMLCSASTGWAGNPRGWFNEPALAVTGPAGSAAFAQRCDALIERTIGILRAMDAQGVVFWDLEGREHPLGYVGDPRQLARLAPEMEACSDRLFARLRAAGFAVGMAVRTQEVVLTAAPAGVAARLQAVGDAERQVAAKIEYARARWGATIFPLLGGGGAAGMAELCRRVLAAQPGILLLPVSDDAQAYRWSAPWQDPASPPALAPAAARRLVPGAFGVLKTLDAADLARDHDQLVQAAAAGDILTFRAWYDDPTHQQLQAILAAGAAARRQTPPPPR